MFLVATEGRVETVGLGLNAYRSVSAGLILCVSFVKRNRTHHALQLRAKKYVEVEPTGFEVWHDGRMGGRAIHSKRVRDAFYEAGRDDLIEDNRIRLGFVPRVDRVTWTSSREFLGNLLHYSLVRTQLREAHRHRRR